MISQLLSALEYQAYFWIDAKTLSCLPNDKICKWSYCNIHEFWWNTIRDEKYENLEKNIWY